MNDVNKTNGLNNIKYHKEDYCKITEKDFYPPKDIREYQSGIDDIVGGDNFIDYIEYFLDLYEDDLFDN